MAGHADALIPPAGGDPHLFAAVVIGVANCKGGFEVGQADHPGPYRRVACRALRIGVSADRADFGPSKNSGLFVEALLDVGGAIARQHFGGIGAVRAFLELELFGAALFRGHAVLGRDLVGIDQFFRETGGQGNA